jgi:hypothetical protein
VDAVSGTSALSRSSELRSQYHTGAVTMIVYVNFRLEFFCRVENEV